MINLCFGLKFCTNVKNKYEKGIIDHFNKNKSFNSKKMKIMLQHFPIGFDLETIFFMFK
jgi:hypothetical protein